MLLLLFLYSAVSLHSAIQTVHVLPQTFTVQCGVYVLLGKYLISSKWILCCSNSIFFPIAFS